MGVVHSRRMRADGGSESGVGAGTEDEIDQRRVVLARNDVQRQRRKLGQFDGFARGEFMMCRQDDEQPVAPNFDEFDAWG